MKKNYILLTTSLDEKISSTALLDISKETLSLFNNSPYDGIALNLMDPYSGQTPCPYELLNERIKFFKENTLKDIWVRLNFTRIFHLAPDHAYYREHYSIDDVKALPFHGASVEHVREVSTAYFKDIKGADLYNEKGTLDDFFTLWRQGLKFAREQKSGIVFDLEAYNNYKAYKTTWIAEMQQKPVSAIIKRLIEIGMKLADIAAEEYPQVPIWLLFSFLSGPRFDDERYFHSVAYIVRGILSRAKEKNIPLKVIEGGETELNYVNRDVETLKDKILRREGWHFPWKEAFPEHFTAASTITVWDDVSKVSGWTKEDAGTPNPFNRLEDFKPFLKELFAHYDYHWFYQPMCVDYDPFDKEYAPVFHDRLSKVLSEI